MLASANIFNLEIILKLLLLKYDLLIAIIRNIACRLLLKHIKGRKFISPVIFLSDKIFKTNITVQIIMIIKNK